MRHDGRRVDELRRFELNPGFTTNSAGSVLVRAGRTIVLCTASVEWGVPKFRRKAGGWMTAEYAMTPGSTNTRSKRESQNRVKGRTHEIQRLIGRSLRAAVDLSAFGENTLRIDCEVLQADGGTRTASITGAFVALAIATDKLLRTGKIKRNPIHSMVTAVSLGIVKDEALLDLDYKEDLNAQVDMNLVMLGNNEMIEVQATGEQGTLSRDQLNTLLDLGEIGIMNLRKAQRNVLGEIATRLDL